MDVPDQPLVEETILDFFDDGWDLLFWETRIVRDANGERRRHSRNTLRFRTG
jgi:hypothetical protein